jgi:hypothetical protein
MTAVYALWDLETGNLVGGYDTELEALRIVHRSFLTFGPESVEQLALALESRGRTKNIATGVELAERAKAAVEGEPARPLKRRQRTAASA